MQNLSLFESDSQSLSLDNHLSFNFNDHSKTNLITFSCLTETKSYIPITGCVLEHILTTTNLTNCEKLFYLTADSLSLISKSRGSNRSCALPSEDWADRLGCSRSLVFKMQQSLVKKGYFIINKDFDKIGRNKRNLITPTLPSTVFNHLNEKFPTRVGEHASYNPLAECKRSYLDRTKLFIKLNYRLLLTITTNLYLNSQQKTIWLGFYTRCYKNYMLQSQDGSTSGKYSYNNDTSFSFISSYEELSKLYSCSAKHLSKSLRSLEQLGFVKLEHLYIRKKYSNNDNSCDESYGTSNNTYGIQERQDQSLWKITLSLPKDSILELEKVKNRSSFKPNNIEILDTNNNVDSTLVEDCLILGGVKFNLNKEQAFALKSAIIISDNDESNNVGCISYDHTDTSSLSLLPSLGHSPCNEYVDSVIEELDSSNDLEVSESYGYTDSSESFCEILNSLEAFDNKEKSSDGIKCDPTFAKSTLLLNKDLILKIKEFKSNLRAKPKVIFNDFLKKFRKDERASDSSVGKENKLKKKTTPEFNICSELIRNKLKELPKDKADKARKFAYSLVSKKLTTGYAAGLNKHELAKQLIHHAATWKPTKLGNISREKEIDTALAVAWKSIVGGTWQPPLEFAKAEILNYEYRYYRKKYQESGVISYEIKSLESEVNKLLGGWYNLERKIIEESKDLSNKENYMPCLLTTNLKPIQAANVVSGNVMLSEGSRPVVNDYGYSEDYYETKSFNNYNVDLSHIADEQKYLKIQGSNTDLIEINTINQRQYFGKLKTLEVNESGDLVMTIKPNNNQLFDGLSVDNDFRSHALDSNIIKTSMQNLNTDWNKNYSDSSLENDLQENMLRVKSNLDSNTDLQAKVVNTGAVKIDFVIDNILKNLRLKIKGT